MVKMDILITSIILLYKERELDTSGVYDSRDLVRNTLSLSKPKRNLTLSGDMGSLEQDIYELVNKMVENPENYEDKITLLAELNILCKDNLEYYNAVKNAIDVEMSEGGKKKSINSLRGKLYKHYQAVSAAQMVNRLSYNINNKMNSSVESEDKKKVSIQDMIMEVLPQLEALCGNINKKDPGLMDTLVMSSKDDIDVIANKIKAEKMEGGILKTGWKQLNTMLQQGFRRGEMGMICALQHNYKSGISQSLLMQFARYNKPVLKDPKKKPALIYISLEDEIMNVLKFMYRYLYYNENKELPDNTEHDISNLTTEQIQEYVMKRLGMNGYEVILLRADPGLWTYKDLFNTINKYEADGYEFHACIVDYLAKLPTTFCDNSGPAGTGMRDLFNRCRNFFSSL